KSDDGVLFRLESLSTSCGFAADEQSNTGPPKQIQIVKQTGVGMVEKFLIKAGPQSNPRPRKGHIATVTGTRALDPKQRGKIFWTTKDKYGKPYSFQLGKNKVVKGWEDGVMAMQLGERARLTVSPSFGWGVAGFPPWNVPGGATLVFDLELLKIENPPDSDEA